MTSKTRMWIVLFSIVALIAARPLPGAWAANTTAKLTPAAQTIDVGQTTSVTFAVQDVEILYGYQAAIGFNAAVLQVVDANSSKPGVQVQLGTFLQPDFVQQNNADNSLGAIVCVVSQMAPHSAVNGSGVLFTITFKAKAPGVSNIHFTDLKLARADGIEISASQQNAQINVGAANTPTATPTTAAPTPTPTATTAGPTATPTPTATAGPTATPTPTPTATATTAPGQTVIYIVKTGDTLYSIARRFGVTVEALTHLNKITNSSRIYVGQRLIIPRGNGAMPTPRPGATATPKPGTTPVTYIVQRGDTLYSIARRYGTTVQAIATRNNIVNPSRIFVGQRLIIHGSVTPSPRPATRTHIVQRGETLYSIARRYGVTAWAIAMTNHLYNPNIIYAGQRLIIP